MIQTGYLAIASSASYHTATYLLYFTLRLSQEQMCYETQTGLCILKGSSFGFSVHSPLTKNNCSPWNQKMCI